MSRTIPTVGCPDPRHRRGRTATTGRPRALLGLGLVAALATGACATGTGAGAVGPGPATAAPTRIAGPSLIPQPPRPDLPLAPDSRRVDLVAPTFARPTMITNPLFPVSAQHSVLHLGHAEGVPLRTEVTTLPFTSVVDWAGQRIEVALSQYTLFLDGRITEAAIDRYAQADDGSVWYLGEDVYRYADGVVFDTDGTWLAGKDGPPALIMPGAPAVGQVFRPENIPGLVFEEVAVTSIDKVVDGPRGPIPGGLAAGEVHRDGTGSEKLFAPGYGEVFTSSATELETMALVVPVDALPGPVPAEVGAITSSAGGLFDAARIRDWSAAAGSLEQLRAAWTAVRGGDVPAQLKQVLDGSLAALTVAVPARDPAAAGQGAVDALRCGLDLQLRHRPVPEIDLARMDVWGRQLLLDATAADPAGLLHGDVAAVKYVRDRLLRAVDRADLTTLDQLIHDLSEAAEGPDIPSVTATTTALREAVATIRPAR